MEVVSFESWWTHNLTAVKRCAFHCVRTYRLTTLSKLVDRIGDNDQINDADAPIEQDLSVWQS